MVVSIKQEYSQFGLMQSQRKSESCSRTASLPWKLKSGGLLSCALLDAQSGRGMWGWGAKLDAELC